MAIVSDSLLLLVWFLISVIVVFLYVDIRIGKLRKELLSHYALCEKMVSTILKDRQGNGTYQCDTDPRRDIPYNGYANDIFPKVVPATVDDEFIPTRDEMVQGMQRLDTLDKNSWIQPNTSVIETGIHAFDNWEFQGGDYAPFRVPKL